MGEKVRVSSSDEYYSRTRGTIKVTSGSTMMVKCMDPESMSTLWGILPDEGLNTQEAMFEFVKDNFVLLTEKVISPNLVQPKIPPKDIFYIDAVELLAKIMELSGMTKEDMEETERFRE